MKRNTFFALLSWLWLSLVIVASLVPKPKYYIRQMIKKLLKMIGSPDMDKNVHFIFYFLLVFFFIMAYKNTKWRIFIFIGAIAASAVIEVIQPILSRSSRRYDVNDLMYNVAGCAVGLICGLTVEFVVKCIRERLHTKPI